MRHPYPLPSFLEGKLAEESPFAQQVCGRPGTHEYLGMDMDFHAQADISPLDVIGGRAHSPMRCRQCADTKPYALVVC